MTKDKFIEPPKCVEINVPCSTSNLGPGYDSIGLALALSNGFLFERIDSGVEITVQGEGAQILERGVQNRTYRAFRAVFEGIGREPPGVKIVQKNSVPLARGLGGSATAVLAGTTAAYLFAGVGLETSRILDQSSVIETHPDNLTPSLVGGLTVSVVDNGHIAYVKVTPPSELTTVTLVPDRPLETSSARRVVPKQFSREDMIFNIRGAGMVMAALATGNLESLALAMRDRLHQPYRAPLLLGMMAIFQAALAAGSPGVALSGGGSGIFAFAYHHNAEAIGEAMKAEAAKHGMGGYVLHLPIDNRGMHVVSVS